jgi:hypothetical protein
MRSYSAAVTTDVSHISAAINAALVHDTTAEEANYRPQSAAMGTAALSTPVPPWVSYADGLPVPKDATAAAYVDYVMWMATTLDGDLDEMTIAEWYDEYKAVCLQAGFEALTPMKWSKGMERAGVTKRQVERSVEKGVRRRVLVFDWPMQLLSIMGG